MTIEAWPKDTQAPRLEFAARSLAPRTVTVRQDGGELWRGRVGLELTPRQSVLIPLKNGRATIEIDTDTPGVRKGPNADARLLAFALYDARLVLPEP